MSTPDSPARAIESPEAARPAAARTSPLQWSVRRELWQNPWILIGPPAAGIILIASFVLGIIVAPERVAGLIALAAERHDAAARPHGFAAAAAAAMVAMSALIVGVFYCLDALQGERLDRSILFWKSLPVSDVTTVLSKACIPLAVLPLVVFAVTLGLHALMLLAGTIALGATGKDSAALWREAPLLEMPVVSLYRIVVMTCLHAPLYAWLLMVSAWARRRAALWAFLPPLGIIAAEQMAFGHSRLRDLLEGLIMSPFAPSVIERVAQLDPAAVFGRPGVWIGLGVTAAFLLIAIRLRRDREPT